MFSPNELCERNESYSGFVCHDTYDTANLSALVHILYPSVILVLVIYHKSLVKSGHINHRTFLLVSINRNPMTIEYLGKGMKTTPTFHSVPIIYITDISEPQCQCINDALSCDGLNVLNRLVPHGCVAEASCQGGSESRSYRYCYTPQHTFMPAA